jgi:phosphatidylinositol-binding clathrin assembly protein
MSKVDAERALAIYKTFSRQTEQVVKFLTTARTYENATRLQIPNLKHAPTGLTSSLEDYLNDPDFEVNRRQYLAQQEAKRTGRPVQEVQAEQAKKQPASAAAAAPAKAQAKGPAPDLIDFFDSIEQNQQAMSAPPQQQVNTGQIVPQYGFQQQQPFGVQNGQMQQGGFSSTNPFAQMVSQQGSPPLQQPQGGFGQQLFNSQPQYTGYNAQPGMQPLQTQFNTQLSTIPQDQQASFSPQQQQQQFPNNAQSPQQQFTFSTGMQQPQQQPFGQPAQQQQQQQAQTGANQSTNPFRTSMMPQNTQTTPFTSSPPPNPGLQRQSTNPFARTTSPQGNSSPFNSAPPGSSSPFASQQQPMRTGTNPFARSPPASSAQSSATPLSAQATGTNPFRQTAFINQQTGQGWQQGNNQGTMGGLENMDTVSIFPRPAAQGGLAQQAFGQQAFGQQTGQQGQQNWS